MKIFIIVFTLLSAVPIFAQDSLSFEELPACCINFDKWAHQYSTQVPDTVSERHLAIDTCKALEVISRTYWFENEDDSFAASMVRSFQKFLLDKNVFFSNQLQKVKYYDDGEMTGIFKDTNQYLRETKIDIEALTENYQDLSDFFASISDKFGEFELFGEYSKINDSTYRVLSFDFLFKNYVSLKYLIAHLTNNNFAYKDFILFVPLSVAEKAENDKCNITSSANGINIFNIVDCKELEIYDLIGNLKFKTTLDGKSEYFIPIDTSYPEVLFIRIDSHIFKIIR